ncbi:MAG: pyruvate kinase [Sulfobacillus sp.]|nr:pyruvate kinase [Sulfobacillus sp.]
MRRTKIVATIGPATRSFDRLAALAEAGMDVARINLSHGDVETHRETIRQIRAVETQTGRPLAIMLDTAGPEIRITTDAAGLTLVPGQRVRVGTQAADIQVDEPRILTQLTVGTRLILDDGNIVLRVLAVGDPLEAEVLIGGRLMNRKKMISPDSPWDLDILTKEDRAALAMGVEEGVDWIAASFVRSPDDIIAIRRELEDHGRLIPIMAKIENVQAVDAIEAIVTVADGVMVARGDLGIELPVEEVPWLQKKIIAAANRAGKPVVTATQMLESMIAHPRPTRAEVTDVAHAIMDGTDAVMLSAETASGDYPVEAVRVMAQVAEAADQQAEHFRRYLTRGSITEAVSHASVTAAEDLQARAILSATESGSTALAVAALRPRVPIIALTPYLPIARRLTIVWGVVPVVTARAHSTDQMMDNAVTTALAHGWVASGDRVVLTAGVPIGQTGTTNLMRVITIGDIVVKGQGVGVRAAASGPVITVQRPDQVTPQDVVGKVLVAPLTNEEWMPLIENASAIIVESGGLTSHAAIVGLSLGKPTIVGAVDALTKVPTGQIVTVDGAHGVVYRGTVQV